MGARTALLGEYGDDFAWSLLDAVPDGILVATASGAIVFVNERLPMLFGGTTEEVLRLAVDDLLPEELRAAHRVHRVRYGTHPEVRPMGAGLTLRARRLDGSEFHTEISLSPLRLGGEVFVLAAVRDVSERVRTESQLLEQAGALREAERALIVAEDRDRIARDLHDTVIQRLFGTGLGLQSAMTMVDEPARNRVERAIDDIDDIIRELRSAIFSLQSADSTTAPGGIRHEVVEIVTDIANDAGFKSQLRFEGAIESMDPRIAEQLNPTVREALSNVAKHAHAGVVTVRLVVDDDVTLTVTDDGDGPAAQPGTGRGLENMASRAAQLGGHSELRRRDHGGSVFSWTVPSVPAGSGA